MKPDNETEQQSAAYGQAGEAPAAGTGRPKKIIAIGLVEHMGDIAACEPVSRYLRALYPADRLIWCVRKEYRELIDSNPNIDETYVVTCVTEWLLLSQTRVFDEIYDLHINYRYCFACKVPYQKLKGNLNVKELTYYTYGNLLSAFAQGAGLPALNANPKVYIDERVRASVDRLRLPTDFIAIHGQSNETSRDWLTERWGELVSLIRTTLNIPVVEVGMRSVTNDPAVITLCGRLAILETAEVINRATLFVGVDSGPARLAHAVQTFGIVLLGRYKVFQQYMPFSGDYGNGVNAELIYAEGETASLTVQQVYDAVQRNIPFARRQKDSKQFFAAALSAAPALSTSEHDASNHPRARLIAFYLPQFHPIPENDAWGGKGFTEWTNVTKALPLFPGHYQPHLPGELGFYDLRLPDARIAQAELAKQHGIEGFCYWHYWFGHGKRLLDRPFTEVLDSGTPDFPFCLAWANESWSARWYGTEKDIIQLQEYPGAADDEAHFHALLPAFRDPRYITIDGKPVFAIYYPGKLPDVAATIALWRRLAAENGLPGVYFIALKTMYETVDTDWHRHGFDAELHHMPDFRDVHAHSQWQHSQMQTRREKYPNDLVPQQPVQNTFDYATAAAFMKRRLDGVLHDHDAYATVVCSWDNSPRYGARATILDDASPAVYERWLEAEVARVVDRSQDHRVIFINAWNEWAEGMHLEPDQKYCRGYVEATRRAVMGEAPPDPSSRKSDLLRGGKFMSISIEELLDLYDVYRQTDLSREHPVLLRSMLMKTIGEFSLNFHSMRTNTPAATPEEYQRAQSRFATVLSFLAESHIGRGQFEAADEMLQLAMNIDKEAVVISSAAVVDLIGKGYTSSPLQILSNLLTASPNDFELFHVLGELLLSIGERQKAFDIYAHILAHDPDNVSAKERYRELQNNPAG